MNSVTCGQLAAWGWGGVGWGGTRIHGCVVEKYEPNKVGVSWLINRCYLVVVVCSEIFMSTAERYVDSLETSAVLGR